MPLDVITVNEAPVSLHEEIFPRLVAIRQRMTERAFEMTLNLMSDVLRRKLDEQGMTNTFLNELLIHVSVLHAAASDFPRSVYLFDQRYEIEKAVWITACFRHCISYVGEFAEFGM